MRKALYIALKDVRRTFRDLPALATMLAAPLIIALVLGAAFGGSKGFSIAPTRVVLVNLDVAGSLAATAGGPTGATAPTATSAPTTTSETAEANAPSAGGQIGDAIVAALTSEGLKTLLVVAQADTEQEARAQVDSGDAAVSVIIPAGLTAAVSAAQSRGATVTLYRDPTKTIGPGIVNTVIQQVVGQTNGAWAAAGTAAQLAVDAGVTDPAAVGRAAAAAAAGFIQEMQRAPGLTVTAREPQVTAAEKTKDVGVAGPVLVGMMVFFMFLAASNVARSILDEDLNGTLPRLFTTPTPRGVILGGKFLSVFLTVLIQAAVLIVAGRLIFGIDWGGAAPVAALTFAGAGVAAGFAVFLMSLAHTPGQAGAISSGVFLVMALVGGNFVGTSNPGGAFGIARLFTPNGWLLRAWDSTLRGGTLSDALPSVGVVVTFALVTFLLGVGLFRRRFT